MPTETVYGLAADASDPDAVLRIYEAKGRPRFNPLICHVASLDDARAIAGMSPAAEALARAFWPGPLTLVLPRAPGGGVCDLATAGLSTVGVRVPDHPVALELLRRVARPLAAPSANRSEELSPTTAQAVDSALGERIDLILDGGPCTLGDRARRRPRRRSVRSAGRGRSRHARASLRAARASQTQCAGSACRRSIPCIRRAAARRHADAFAVAARRPPRSGAQSLRDAACARFRLRADRRRADSIDRNR
jgi:tRNA threonylcarbamoyl adenosine modification protein (Sua5/YciO/YrdC/YwlC family)